GLALAVVLDCCAGSTAEGARSTCGTEDGARLSAHRIA
ncbi:MAG: hypothetical protein ACI841_000749, partial [Planctomycetota bacterium]